MNTEELEEIIKKQDTKRVIKEQNLKSNIERIVKKNNKEYIQLAFWLANEIVDNELYTKEGVQFEKLSDKGQKVLKIIRNDAAKDKKYLKGDFVLSTILEMIIKTKDTSRCPPPNKRLQVKKDDIKKIFLFRKEGISFRKISEKLSYDRRTIKKVVDFNYQNQEDIVIIKKIKDSI